MKNELRKFLLTSLLAFATLITVSIFSDNQLVCFVLLLCLSLLMLSIEWNWKNVLLFLIILISGPLAESLPIYYGAWTYSNPVILGLPIWLPFVWGNAGLFIIRLSALVYSNRKSLS